jgi:hypothetical protein
MLIETPISMETNAYKYCKAFPSFLSFFSTLDFMLYCFNYFITLVVPDWKRKMGSSQTRSVPALNALNLRKYLNPPLCFKTWHTAYPAFFISQLF